MHDFNLYNTLSYKMYTILMKQKAATGVNQLQYTHHVHLGILCGSHYTDGQKKSNKKNRRGNGKKLGP